MYWCFTRKNAYQKTGDPLFDDFFDFWFLSGGMGFVAGETLNMLQRLNTQRTEPGHPEDAASERDEPDEKQVPMIPRAFLHLLAMAYEQSESFSTFRALFGGFLLARFCLQE